MPAMKRAAMCIRHLSLGNTEARTPSAVLAPGVPELSLILGSRPTAGCRGMGCRTASTRTAATPLSGDGGAVRFA